MDGEMSIVNSKQCVCGLLVDLRRWFVKCDGCRGAFHGSCVNILERELDDVLSFICPLCKIFMGPTVMRNRANNHRYDYMDANASEKPIETGTQAFIEELKKRTFVRSDGVVTRMNGTELTWEHLYEDGFEEPILVDDIEGLDMIVPYQTFTVYDAEKLIGQDFKVDVLDVIKQADIQMTFHEFVDYFNNPVRRHVLNLVNLEFSQTELGKYIQPPYVARKLDWVNSAWPKPPDENTVYPVPAVSKYCFISMKDSYTDFHVDFGGSSVWYHVFQGEKIFYLIKPTVANLVLYQAWVNSPNKYETFFADQVDECYELVIKPGQTLFVPTGWIHAVYTPKDSMAFGGNFIHCLNIPLQIKCYIMETTLTTPRKFIFPSFEVTHWYGATLLLQELKNLNEVNKKCPKHILAGVKILITILRQWYTDANREMHQEIPAIIDPPLLLKSLLKEVKYAEGLLNISLPRRPVRESTRKRRPRVNMDFVEFPQTRSVNKKFVEVNGLKLTLKVSAKSRKKSSARGRSKAATKRSKSVSKSTGNVPASNKKKNSKLDIKESNDIPVDPNSYISSLTTSTTSSSIVRPPIKLTLPKPATFPYSNNTIGSTGFYDSEDTNFGDTVLLENAVKDTKESPEYSPVKPTLTEGSLKMKVVKDADTYQICEEKEKPFQPLTSTPNTFNHRPEYDAARLAIYDFQDSDEEGALVVDETPTRKPKYTLPLANPLHLNTNTEDGADSDSSSGNINDTSATKSASTSSSPTRSLSVSSSILSAQKILAGTLSIHRGFVPLDQKKTQHKLREKDRKYELVDDQNNASDEVHQDEQYVYPSLDISDEEEEVIPVKKRGKRKADEAWNPNARIGPLVPKSNRPTRERKKNQAVEKGLEAAAAKRAAVTPAPPTNQASDLLLPVRATKKKPLIKVRKPSVLLQSSPLLPSSPLLSSALASAHQSSVMKKDKKTKQERKPKKGMATAKQRLGKILKIHKMQF